MPRDRTATVIVEPDHSGHHFQAVSTVVSLASRRGPVVLLTSAGASTEASFAAYLGRDVAEGAVTVQEVFDGRLPSTATMVREAVRAAAEPALGDAGATIVMMDGDQALKRWWFVAPRVLRQLRPRPRVIFMLTRYPARLALTDLTSWRLRGPKAVLTVLAMATGSLHRAVGFAGREDRAVGWIVKRVRDPHYSSAHARDRVAWRTELGLPLDRHLVGIFGALDIRKNPALVFEAIRSAGLDADLVLAGRFDDEVKAWVAGLDEADRSQVITRDEFLDNDTLDRYVAAVDVVPLALTNNGPSGIMGKAAAAGVPVVTTGSTVRAREVRATGTGLECEFTAESIGAAMRHVVLGPFEMPEQVGDAEVPPEEFARTLLGVDGREDA